MINPVKSFLTHGHNVGSCWPKMLRPSALGLMSRFIIMFCFESFLMKSFTVCGTPLIMDFCVGSEF